MENPQHVPESNEASEEVIEARALHMAFHALIRERDRLRDLEQKVWALNHGEPPPHPISSEMRSRVDGVNRSIQFFSDRYNSMYARKFGPLR